MSGIAAPDDQTKPYQQPVETTPLQKELDRVGKRLGLVVE
jgi:hypothetical protein